MRNNFKKNHLKESWNSVEVFYDPEDEYFYDKMYEKTQELEDLIDDLNSESSWTLAMKKYFRVGEKKQIDYQCLDIFNSFESDGKEGCICLVVPISFNKYDIKRFIKQGASKYFKGEFDIINIEENKDNIFDPKNNKEFIITLDFENDLTRLDLDEDLIPDETIDGEAEVTHRSNNRITDDDRDIEVSHNEVSRPPITRQVGLDPRDQAVVDKLVRIANDTKDAIEKYYGVEVNQGAIVADMIQDLRLISGDINPEQLEDTPINRLTKEMYQMYDGFNNMIDDLISGITGTRFERSKAERLTQAIGSLDSPNFSKRGIEQSIASDRFLTCVQNGSIPFLPSNTQRLALPESYRSHRRIKRLRESKNQEKDIISVLSQDPDFKFTDKENKEYEKEAEKHLIAIDSYDLDQVEDEWKDYGFTDDIPEDPVDASIWRALNDRRIDLLDDVDNMTDEEKENRFHDKLNDLNLKLSDEWDESNFTRDINEYLEENYKTDEDYPDYPFFTACSGKKDRQGNILIEGRIDIPEKDEKYIQFTLQPTRKINEGLKGEKQVYIVKNNLSEEVFEFINK